MKPIRTVYVTGGAGYVGAVLVPKLLAAGYQVRVLDLFIFGDDVFPSVANHPGLQCIKGDMRDQALLKRTLAGCDAVIHLACISNDPSFERQQQQRVRRQARAQRHGRLAARAPDRLLQIQGAL